MGGPANSHRRGKWKVLTNNWKQFRRDDMDHFRRQPTVFCYLGWRTCFMCIVQSHKFTIRHFRLLIQTREEKSCIEKDTFQQSNRFSPSSVAFRQTIHPDGEEFNLHHLWSPTLLYVKIVEVWLLCAKPSKVQILWPYTHLERGSIPLKCLCWTSH